MDCDTLEIKRGTNPDIIFEFFAGDEETDPRLDLNGAVLTVTSNIPGYLTPVPVPADLAQGIIVVPMPEAITSSMKLYTDYAMTVRAVDVTGKIHMVTIKFKVL